MNQFGTQTRIGIVRVHVHSQKPPNPDQLPRTKTRLNTSIAFITMVFGHHFDFTNYVSIELFQLFSWDPVFLMHRTAYRSDLVPVEIFISHSKASYITGLTQIALSVPITCNLNCILFIQDGVKNWLFWEAWRKLCEIALSN